jgi:holliday junction DNA helicase RuvA
VECVIGYLQGRALNERVVLTPAGVGYLVHTPTPLVAGEEVELWVNTVVREDAITCYGFVDQGSQECFTALTKVAGVGPSAALALLRDVGVAGIAAAVTTSDEKPLCKASGVGPSVARKIIAAVKLPASVLAASSAAPDPHSEMVETLTTLGFGEADAANAVRNAAAALGATCSEPDLLAAALAELRR